MCQMTLVRQHFPKHKVLYNIFAAAVAVLMFHLISPKRFAEARLARWLQLIVIYLGEGWANDRYGTGGLGSNTSAKKQRKGTEKKGMIPVSGKADSTRER